MSWKGSRRLPLHGMAPRGFSPGDPPPRVSPPDEDVRQGSQPASSNAEEVHGDDGDADGVHEEDHCPALVPGGWASEASLLDPADLKEYIPSCILWIPRVAVMNLG